jgi:hypothetical protein
MLEILGRHASSGFFDNPIFIVGGSRSGTIALFKAVGLHPLILSTPSEDPFITDIGRMAYDLAHASERDLHYYARTLRIPRDYIFDTLRRLALESALGPRYGLKHLLVQSIRSRKMLPAKRYWCTKTFPGENTAKGLQALYPKARFIWILRNGINVVHSRTKFPEFRDLAFSEHCQHWADSIHRFAYLSSLPEATVVHQEDLANDPDAVFRRIFALVGVPYHPASTQFALNNHVHPLADEHTSQDVNVKEVLKQRVPPNDSWSPDQKSAFQTICGGAMALAGYDMPY